jgi:hypothetical protein
LSRRRGHTMGKSLKKRVDFDEPLRPLGVVELAAVA